MKWIAVFLVVFAILALPITASAKGAEDYLSDFSSLIPDGMEDRFENAEALTEGLGFESIVSEIYKILSQNGGVLASFLAMVIGLSLITALTGSIEGSLSRSVRSCASAVSAVAVFGSISPLISTISSALSEITSFFDKLIPVFAGVTVAGGGANAASVSTVGMTLTLGVIGGFSSEVLGSVVSVLFALGLVFKLGGGSSVGLFKSVKGIFISAIGLVTFILGATLSLQTVIASASDSMLMRSAKFTASGMIPIVGSSVSGAISTLASGLSYAKSFIGTGAILVIVTIATAPAVLLFAYRTILSFSVDFLGFLDTGGGNKCFSSMLGALDCLIAVFSMSTLVYIFEIILFIKSGVALI